MASSPMLSVLMPVYKVSTDYLDLAIESILNQTHRAFEFIIISDGAPQEVVNRLKFWEKQDPRIRLLFNEENQGISYTLNRGVKEAKYPLIARMDADDTSFPQRFELQLKYLQQHPEVDFLTCLMCDLHRPEIIYPTPETHSEITFNLLFDNPLSHCGMIMRKEKIEALNGYNSTYDRAEDYDLWTRACLKGFHIATVPSVLMQYRTQYQANSTYKDKTYKPIQNKVALQIREHYIRQTFSPLAYSTERIESYIRNLLGEEHSRLNVLKNIAFVETLATQHFGNLNYRLKRSHKLELLELSPFSPIGRKLLKPIIKAITRLQS